MKHLYFEGKPDHPVYLLFHGTGGDENDLIPLAKHLDPEASILSFQGDVNEGGMLRFFKRLAMGVLDEADLTNRANAMHERLLELYTRYGLENHTKIALGYSNGANLIAGMLYIEKAPFDVVSLHHPMKPFKTRLPKTLPALKVHIHAGTNDPICPYEHVSALEDALTKAGAHVAVYDYHQGHALTQEEVEKTKAVLGRYV